MKTNLIFFRNRVLQPIFLLAAIGLAPQLDAAELSCTGPQMGEIFIDTKNGNVTKSAQESLTVEMTIEKTHYGFVFKGKKNKFKATVNRFNGDIILEDACLPECWGGPLFGTCTAVKPKL